MPVGQALEITNRRITSILMRMPIYSIHHGSIGQSIYLLLGYTIPLPLTLPTAFLIKGKG